DRRRDIRHNAESENRELAETAATEEVENPQNGTLRLTENLVEHLSVDAGRGNVRTNTIDAEKRNGKKDAVPQIRDAEHILESFDESFHSFALRFFVTT